MQQNPDASSRQETFQRLKEVRAEFLRHARQLAAERRDLIRLIRGLLAGGFSQADIARELGVTSPARPSRKVLAR